MNRTIALPLTALALVAAACTSAGDASPDPGPGSEPATTDTKVTDPDDGSGTSTPTTDPDGDAGSNGTTGPIGFAPAALAQFPDCSAFLDYVHTEGVDRVGPYGFGDGGFYGPLDDFARDVAVQVEEAPAEEASAEPDIGSATADTQALPQTDNEQGADGTFSTTNVQVDGVDEPDIVKTDGDRIIAIAGETLHYVDVSADGTTGTKRGSIALTLDGRYAYGYEIFISGDRAFVFAQGEQYFEGDFVDTPFVGEAETVAPAQVTSQLVDAPETVEGDAEVGFAPEPEPEPAPEPMPTEIVPPTYFGPQTVILEVDLSNPDALTIPNRMAIDGRYISARSIGDTARVVVTSPPQDLGFLYPSSPGTEDKATEANREVVRISTVEDWIPELTVTSADGAQQTRPLVDCADIHAPADFGGFDMLSVLTLDLGAGLDAATSGAAVMASGDTVYASADRLYVTTNIWLPVIDEQTRQWFDENYQTAIHRFSIAGDGPATYEASGSIEGHLLNQFSMNDRDGVFYAAVTKGAPWGDRDTSESEIVAMEVTGDRLEEVGSVGGLGKGERIFSVRYVDETAYVVTFRQVDPFYIVDLSDPRNMAVQGELKIPGYSSYLHPISDDLVLGVGQDATDDGRTTGTKVSLFDVSDPANPTEVDVWSLPSGFSDAEFDHRAFLWWAPTNTAVLPLQSYTDRFSGAIVLNVTAEGITEQGRITHADAEVGPIGQTDCRVLTAEEVGTSEDNEFFWVNQDGGQVQLCGTNDAGGAVGLFCNPIPAEELQYYFVDGQVTFDIGDAERVELCWPDWNGYQTAVQRTMVIDGNLWTLSPERIQSNDLGTLDRSAAIDLF
jgi:hypothetical protein